MSSKSTVKWVRKNLETVWCADAIDRKRSSQKICFHLPLLSENLGNRDRLCETSRLVALKALWRVLCVRMHAIHSLLFLHKRLCLSGIIKTPSVISVAVLLLLGFLCCLTTAS